MPNTKYSSARLLLIGLLLVCSIDIPVMSDDRSFEQSKNLEILNALYKEIDLYYVDTIQPEKFIRTGINAMLNDLDPYTDYMPESEVSQLEFITTGEYGGVGALIMLREDRVEISRVYEGMPAAEAGLQPGDIFMRIDSVDVSRKSQSEISDLLKGHPNTPIRVEVKRPGVEEPIVKEFIRQRVTINTVEYYGVVGRNTGYIRLTNFTDKSAQEVKTAYQELKTTHKIESLIIDLRDNPGGVMETAIQIVNFFVPKGSKILTTRGKVRQFDREYKATIDPIDTKIPLAIMINQGSASSSEIMSGALQDLDRAVLFGSRSYGKGLVQTSRPLPYNGAVKVTSAKYYIPSGRCIQAIDYKHRNPDGSVGAIPDSLTKEFTTLNGRKVKDGGGVTPDRPTSQNKVPNIIYYLSRDFLVHDYATNFHIKHEQIGKPSLFELTDEQYDEFKALVKSKNFKYDRQSEKMLESLKEMMVFEGYLEDAKEEYKALETKLSHNIDRDLDIFKPEIKAFLQTEICRRYFYARGAVEQELKYDNELKEVLSTLADKNAFKALLKEPGK